MVATVGSAAPTGLLVVDVVYRAGIGALVAYAGSRAARWTWVIIAAASLAAAHEWWQVPAAVALLLAVWASFQPRTSRRMGTLVAGLSIQGLLHWSSFGFHGAPTVFAVAAVMPLLVSAYRRSSDVVRRRARLGGLTLGAAAVVLGLPFIVSVLLARGPIDDGVANARAALGIEQSRSGDPATDLGDAASSIGRAQTWVSGPWTLGARLVPGLAQQQRALSYASGVASDLADETSGSLGKVGQDALELRKGRLDLQRVRTTADGLVELREQLETLTGRFADDRLESPWLLGPTRSMVDDLQGGLRGGGSYADSMAGAARALPSLMGGDGTRRYLVVLVDPRVARGAGGVARAYAHVSAEDGRIALEDHGPIEDLAGDGATDLDAPDGFVWRYGPYRPGTHLGDVTYTPDLGDLREVLAQVDETVTAHRPLDGLIVVDPAALGAIGRLADAKVDVPVGDLGGESDVAVNARFATALGSTLEAVLAADLPGPGAIAQQLGPLVEQGSLAIQSRHDADQRFLRSAGLTREIAPLGDRGDVLGITSQSVRADGLDRYVERHADVTVTPSPSGEVVSEVRLTLRNTAPRGSTRQWVTLYTQGDLVGLAEGSGFLPVRGELEAGVMAYSTFVDLAPGQERVLVYGTRASLDLASGYRLHVFDQPGLAESAMKVSIEVPSNLRTVAVRGAELHGESIKATVKDGGQADVSVRSAPRREDR